jgi:hypothetical protein
MNEIPQLTFSKIVIGFEEWFKANFNDLVQAFTPEAEHLFDTLEDFAVEIFFEQIPNSP